MSAPVVEVVQHDPFDYETLDTETRIIVQQRAREVRDDVRRLRGLVRQTAETVWSLGDRLLDVQQRLTADGQFLAWCRAELPDLSRGTIYNALNVRRAFAEFPTVGNELDIPLKALYLLAAPSTPQDARVEALQRAEAGARIGHKEAKAIVAAYQPEPAPESPRARKAAIEDALNAYDFDRARELAAAIDDRSLRSEWQMVIAARQRLIDVPLPEVTNALHRANVLGVNLKRPDVRGGSWMLQTDRNEPALGLDWPGVLTHLARLESERATIGPRSREAYTQAQLRAERLGLSFRGLETKDDTYLWWSKPGVKPEEISWDEAHARLDDLERRRLDERGIAPRCYESDIPPDWDAWRARARTLTGGDLHLSDTYGAELRVHGVVAQVAYVKAQSDAWSRITAAIERHEQRPQPAGADITRLLNRVQQLGGQLKIYGQYWELTLPDGAKQRFGHQDYPGIEEALTQGEAQRRQIASEAVAELEATLDGDDGAAVLAPAASPPALTLPAPMKSLADADPRPEYAAAERHFARLFAAADPALRLFLIAGHAGGYAEQSDNADEVFEYFIDGLSMAPTEILSWLARRAEAVREEVLETSVTQS